MIFNNLFYNFKKQKEIENMKIILNGVEKTIDKPCRIADLIEDKDYHYMAANVNNRLRELDYIIKDSSEIQLLDLKNADVCRIYQSTLRYVILMATKNVFPNAKIIFNYSVSRSIFASVSQLGHPFLQEDLNQILWEVNRIIEQDYPIKRYSITKEEAYQYYQSIGCLDKVKILKYRKEDTVHTYECNGYKNYMFGYMLRSTGYLKKFNIKLYSPGFIVSYPRSECGGEIPNFQEERVFRASLKDANRWADTSRSGSISQMNEIVETNRALEFINICEARHNRQLADLGNKIMENIDNIHLIAVAGPSSSGKTTFTNRLRIELKSRGIDPLMISIDNFYNDPQFAPRDKDGNPDFEHIDSLDRTLFNEVLYKLIQGESVSLPVYDFKTRTRHFETPIRLHHHQPILIEGIHALNDDLTPSIATEEKFKIYIAPLAQYRIDDHNPISISDIRLIRRIVRDHQYRNTNCEKTLATWQSVRNGEFKWIYPFQNNADFVFNSELSYELCVMQKHAIPLLKEVPSDSPNFITANRLVKFLKYFKSISDKWIPCNSILREFIGDSIFYTEDTI